MVPGLADGINGVSFRSYSHPDRYIRHRDFQIWVESGSDSLFERDATFIMEIKNPRDFIKQDADWRADALGGALKGYLDQIGRGEYSERQSLLDTTLLKSRVLDAVVEHADLMPPKVTRVTPANNNATGVKRNSNITVTFSEEMDRDTLTKSTIKLYRVNSNGSTSQVTNVTVTPSSDGQSVTLNPYGASWLAPPVRYARVAGSATSLNPNLARHIQSTNCKREAAFSLTFGAKRL